MLAGDFWVRNFPNLAGSSDIVPEIKKYLIKFTVYEEVKLLLRIRLTRRGAKRNPHYRVVVTEKSSPRDGRFKEIVGHYNPALEPVQLRLDLERVDHWIANGAQPTRTVKTLINRVRTQAQAAADTAEKVAARIPQAEPEKVTAEKTLEDVEQVAVETSKPEAEEVAKEVKEEVSQEEPEEGKEKEAPDKA